MYLRRYFPLVVLALTLLTNSVNAQLFEDFESGSKGSYAGGSVSLATGDWYMNDALIGNLSNDKYNGSQGVRMDRRDGKMGNIYMLFDKADGADEISFYIANYGSSTGNTLQVQYSTDSGSSWSDLGDPIAATETLTESTLSVKVDGDIRFKFIQEAGTDRLNIDDIKITDYVTPSDNPAIALSVDDEGVPNNQEIDFGTAIAGNTLSKSLEIKNTGNQMLVLDSLIIGDGAFSYSTLSDDSLDFDESVTITLDYSPQAEGNYTGILRVYSNSESDSVFTLNLKGDALSNSAPITIAQARELPTGTRVTVSGIVTVAEAFRGPMYFQDGTGGLAWYNSAMRVGDNNEFTLNVHRGDSIVITGDLGEFNDLIQIVESDEDYEFFEALSTTVAPQQITIAQMNSGDFEGQLVAIDAAFESPGALQGDNNYTITDGTGSGVVRISRFTDIVDTNSPEGTSTIVGVVGVFGGTYQLLPRDKNDIDSEEVIIPGNDVSMDKTFDIVTWNIEWFGASNGPDDDDLQLENVKTVITTLDADVYALQEISNESYFDQLVSDLEDYGGFRATYSQTQKTAYLFKRSTVDSLDSGLISTGMTASNWANGRFPLLFHFNVSFDSSGSREFYMYNIHAKAFGDESSYNQRFNASREVKTYFDTSREQDNVILIGDYNDEMNQSTYNNVESPYANFIDDFEYNVVTDNLEDKGFGSHSGGSFLDHITFSSELFDEYFQGTEQVGDVSYISNYFNTTSDHYPIMVRFLWADITQEPVKDPFYGAVTSITSSSFKLSTTIGGQQGILEFSYDENLVVRDTSGTALVITDYEKIDSVEVHWRAGESQGEYIADTLTVIDFGLINSVEDETGLPDQLSLSQNYPNPFNPTTMISYQLPVSSEVSLKVFDMLGREVATLVNGRQSAGKQEVRFDASGLSSGIYIYRLKSGNEVLTRKMMLIK